MVTEKNKTIHRRLLSILAALLVILAVYAHYAFDPWGFYWKVSEKEAQLRRAVVQTAESYLGYNEADNSHKAIIDRYNAQEVLPVGYIMQYSDSWCATFVSTVSIQCGLTDILPPECGCERQIALFQELGMWEEADSTIPLPGDLIYYDWNMENRGECTGWADHVGIVVGTKWPFVKVIEGNFRDSVDYHYLRLDHIQIRGFARPDYAGYLEKNTP